MKSFILYGLKRADEDKIRYVGITSESLASRLKRHLRDGRRNPHKGNWIEKIKRDGICLEIVPHCTGLSFEDACSLEISVIRELRAVGHDLLNISNGGEAPMFGRKASKKHIERLRISHLGHVPSPETLVRRSEAMQGIKLPGASSSFRGVHWVKDRNRWFSNIFVNKKKLSLGYYGDEKDAAIAYDWAAQLYFGSKAKLNFP